jgi:LuxR family maltose regulon positive regulatory protein
MAQLLLEAAARGVMSDYTGRLLSESGTVPPQRTGGSPLPVSPASQPLIEPLSQRELAVLRLFRTALSGPEIANELVIALSTVRTHTKRIYSKLAVTNRRAAVRRAEELGLL